MFSRDDSKSLDKERCLLLKDNEKYLTSHIAKYDLDENLLLSRLSDAQVISSTNRQVMELKNDLQDQIKRFLNMMELKTNHEFDELCEKMFECEQVHLVQERLVTSGKYHFVYF